MLSWFSKKQAAVALSLVEVEYMVASLACCEAVWLRKLIGANGCVQLELH
jgi:hypothetical protein